MTRCPLCRNTYPGPRCPRCFPAGNSRGWQWPKLRTSILIRDNFTCQVCQRPCSHKTHQYNQNGIVKCNEMAVDHITPRASGGRDEPSNLRTVHSSFNLRGAC